MMNEKILKQVEEIAKEVVNNSLALRYDICTCDRCKNAIISRVITQIASFPSSSESIDSEEVRNFYVKDIHRAIIPSIEEVSAHPVHRDTEDRKKAFSALLNKISLERGLDLRNYHTDILKRRIALRIQHNKIPSFSGYIEFLTRNPREYDRLFETLCINVSEFLRDPPVWVTIQYLLENLIRSKITNKHTSVKIWSAGCANGEEPYSLAISFKEVLRKINLSMRAEILATDVDKACLESARKAIYTKEQLKNVDTKLLARYFELSGGKFTVREDIRNMVSIDYLDLTSQIYPKNIDALTCRNVFIYFNRQLQKEIVNKFCLSINPGGYLIMGNAESLGYEYENCLEAVDSNAKIFRKFNSTSCS